MSIISEYKGNEFYFHHSKDLYKLNIFNPHIHDKCELYYFISGEATMFIDGAEIILKENTAVLMKPGTTHMVNLTGNSNYERMALIFSNNNSFDFDYSVFYDTNKFILECLNTIVDSQNKEVCFNSFIAAMIYKITESDAVKTPEDEIVKYICNHLTEDITLNSIAERFYISKEHLCRKFKQQTGMGVWEFITKKRLICARENIILYKSVKKGYLASGFNDYSSFYRQYVKFFNTSPKDDLQKAKEIG